MVSVVARRPGWRRLQRLNQIGGIQIKVESESYSYCNQQEARTVAKPVIDGQRSEAALSMVEIPAVVGLVVFARCAKRSHQSRQARPPIDHRLCHPIQTLISRAHSHQSSRVPYRPPVRRWAPLSSQPLSLLNGLGGRSHLTSAQSEVPHCGWR